MAQGGMFGGLGYQPLDWPTSSPAIAEGPVDNAIGSAPASPSVFDTGSLASYGAPYGYGGGTFGAAGRFPGGYNAFSLNPTATPSYMLNAGVPTDLTSGDFGSYFPSGGTSGVPYTGSALTTPEFAPGMYGYGGTTGPDMLSTFGGTQGPGGGYFVGGQPVPSVIPGDTSMPPSAVTSSPPDAGSSISPTDAATTSGTDVTSADGGGGGSSIAGGGGGSSIAGSGGGSGMPIDVGLQPSTTQFISGQTQQVEQSFGGMAQTILSAAQSGLGTVFAGVTDTLLRGILIAVGIVVIIVALWRILFPDEMDKVIRALPKLAAA